MQTLQTGDNTQRVISNDKLIGEPIEKPMPMKKKVVIGVAIFITIAAIVGIAVGLYFHFRPSSTHVQTIVSSTSDGTTYSSTKFVYTDNNMIGGSVNQTFSIVFAGLNSTQTQQRMLQQSQQQLPVDVTLHYTHDSGIKFKFRGNKILNISVPIDQVVQYIAQQQDPQGYARLLQDLTQYPGEDQDVSFGDVYDTYRNDILQSLQSMYAEDGVNVNVHMADADIWEMDYDENSGSFKYTNSTGLDARRRLWSFRHFFHKVGSFFKRAATDVVHFVKKDGLKILKYGAIAALAGIDIAAKGPSGISDAVKMFKSGNVWTAAEMTAQGVATLLPPYLSIPIQFIGQACFSHPPKMHCTKQAAIKAAKDDVISYVKKHAVETILSCFQ